jgi:hypothetical protein
VDKGDNTAQRGLVAQTIILARLVELGREVLLPWGDHRRYDLAYYERDANEPMIGKLVRVQCKLGWLYNDESGVEFSTMSVLVKPGGHHVC